MNFIMSNYILAKLSDVFKILLAPHKIWRLPKKSDVVIYDTTGSSILIDCLAGFTVTAIASRGEFVYAWCLFRSIFTRSFWRGRLYDAYLETCIRVCSPKLVVTFIDNDLRVYRLHNQFPDIQIMVIQNGIRVDTDPFFKQLTAFPSAHVDHLVVFSVADARMYRRYFPSAVITPIGSLRNNHALKAAHYSESDTLLFVSQYRERSKKGTIVAFDINNQPVTYDEFYSVETVVLKGIAQWVSCNKKKLSIAGASLSQTGIEGERRFFSERLKGCQWEYRCRLDDLSSYALTDSADIVVCIDSTLGYESLSRGSKTAFISCREGFNSSFGLRDCFPKVGPFWTNRSDIESIKAVLDLVNAVDNQEWKSLQQTHASDLLVYDSGNIMLKQLMKRVLSGASIESLSSKAQG